jgi:hypothetical protein
LPLVEEAVVAVTPRYKKRSTRPDRAKDFVALASAGACFGLRHEFCYARSRAFAVLSVLDAVHNVVFFLLISRVFSHG